MTKDTLKELKDLLYNKEFIDTLIEKDIEHTLDEMRAGLTITEDFLDEAYRFTNKD